MKRRLEYRDASRNIDVKVMDGRWIGGWLPDERLLVGYYMKMDVNK